MAINTNVSQSGGGKQRVNQSVRGHIAIGIAFDPLVFGGIGLAA
jgi:hypothetical protein